MRFARIKSDVPEIAFRSILVLIEKRKREREGGRERKSPFDRPSNNNENIEALRRHAPLMKYKLRMYLAQRARN